MNQRQDKMRLTKEEVEEDIRWKIYPGWYDNYNIYICIFFLNGIKILVRKYDLCIKCKKTVGKMLIIQE